MSIVKDKGGLRLVFFGTPDFALPSLDAAIARENVVLVVTQPDRPSGRKREIKPPPVKLIAQKKGIEIYQPEDVSSPDSVKRIASLSPDLMVVSAYGSIFREGLLRLPPLGCINIHSSLLPLYRGACPIEWTLIKGETVTGISCIYMDEGTDTGNIILQRQTDISPSDTTGTLRERLSHLGAGVLAEVLEKMEKGKLDSCPQRGEATHAPVLSKDDCVIDWQASAATIHNLVRALNPHIGARTCDQEGKKLIIWETSIRSQTGGDEEPGKVVEVLKDGMVASTGEGYLFIKSIQPEGGKKQTAAEYIRGHRIEKFGSIKD